jgi:hypothetical protein
MIEAPEAELMTEMMLKYSFFAQAIAASATFAIMWRKSLLKKFQALSAFLAVVIVSTGISIVTLFFRQQLGIERHLDYNIFFYSRFSGFDEAT